MSEPARRLFFAFWPDEQTREALFRSCRKAVRGSGGRPVAAENLHVTLAFLGFVPDSGLADLVAAASALDGSAFGVCFDRVAHWPRPQVLVALSSVPPPAAAALAASLWRRLTPLGFNMDARPYQPHVTLARKVRRPGRDLDMRPVNWPVTGLSLVESVTDPAGARYRVIERWPLASGPGSPPEPPAPAESHRR